jgi:hypothetical protein
MFENYKRKKCVKTFLNDIRCIREYAACPDMNMMFVRNCFSFHVMRNMKVQILDVPVDFGEQLYCVEKKDISKEVLDYLERIESFLLSTNLTKNKIIETIVDNKI